jgi:hypothetical protein
MSKSLSLFFAVISVALMLATAFSINTSGWLALLFGILACTMIASGFVIKSRRAK